MQRQAQPVPCGRRLATSTRAEGENREATSRERGCGSAPARRHAPSECGQCGDRARKHALIGQLRDHGAHRAAAGAAHGTAVGGGFVGVVAVATMHRARRAVGRAHRALAGGGGLVATRLGRLDGPTMGRAAIPRDQGRKRRHLADEPEGHPEPKAAPDGGHVRQGQLTRAAGPGAIRRDYAFAAPHLFRLAGVPGRGRLAHGQDRALRRSHHALGHAAHEEVRDAASAMRAHHDEIRAGGSCAVSAMSAAGLPTIASVVTATSRMRLRLLGQLALGVDAQALAQRGQIVGIRLGPRGRQHRVRHDVQQVERAAKRHGQRPRVSQRAVRGLR